MRKLNILQVISIPSWGGQEIAAMELAKKLSAHGHKVIVACIEGSVISYKAQGSDLPQRHLRIRGSLDIKSIIKLILIIRKENIDIVHVHPVGNYWSAIIAAKLCNRKGVVTKHLLNPLHRITKRFLNWSDKIVAVSRACKNFLLEDGIIKEGKITVIYNGVDLSRFNGRVHGSWLRKEFNLSQSDILIGCVGRMCKGQGSLVSVAKDLYHKFPQAKWIFVGPTGGGEAKKQAIELGISDKVIFTGFREDIPEIMADLDIFVFLPPQEAFGLALVEAMASGKPVVASDTGGIPEIVKDKENGFLVPADDNYLETLKAIEYLITNEEQRRLMGEKSMLIAKKEFSFENTVVKTEDLYYQILSK